MFTKLKVMVSCCHCKKVQRLLIENRIGRDADGMDIWPCTECKKKYKLDLQNYMEESDKSFNLVNSSLAKATKKGLIKKQQSPHHRMR